MSNSYLDAIFDFFTTEEAYQNLYKIQEHYPEVRFRIIKEFWQAAEDKLNEISSQKSSDWNVVRVESLEHAWSKLMIYKRRWGFIENRCPKLAVSCEQLMKDSWYGPFVHNRAPGLDLEQARTYLRKLPIAKDFDKTDGDWYPFWNLSGYNFDSHDDILKILPAVRDKAASEVANEMWTLACELEPHFEHIHTKFHQSR